MLKDNFRIALLSPQVIGSKNQIRRVQPPLGLGFIAAVLRASGFSKVKVLDAAVEDYDNIEAVTDDETLIKFGLSDEDCVKRLKEFAPSLVGISSLFSSQMDCVFSLSKAIKTVFPTVPIVLGGNHASSFSREILKGHPQIDYVMTGECDYAFRDFVEKLSLGKEVGDLPGLARRVDSKIVVNPHPPFIKELDALPFPAWDLMPMEKYFKIGMFHNPFVKSGRVGCVITSRGCPQKCYYCSSADFFGHQFRPMSAQRAIEMVGYLVKTFQIKELQILDDNFTLDYKRVIAICEGIAPFGLRITLPNAIRADVPRDHARRLEMFRALRRAGCEQIGMSIEHGCQKFLDDVIGKRLDLKEAVVSCRLAHEVDILVHCNFMVGFPFETALERARTADFARSLEADSFSVSLATPLPGTRMWDIVEKNKLFVDSFNVNRVLFSEVSIKPADISAEDLKEFVVNLNREINAIAAKRNPKAAEKYALFKGKTASGDRKYQYSEKEI